jgi:GT2 family glycosyltransferase
MIDRVYIIVLNWNIWKDTIECLESILKSNYDSYRIVLHDNGSTNDSIKRIESWAQNTPNGRSLTLVKYSKETAEKGGETDSESNLSMIPSNQKVVLIDNHENLGFAAGCNVGIKYALATGSEYIWLLNNDTIIENDSLSKIVETLDLNNNYSAITPQIRYYDHKDKVWNCGGFLKWYGIKKYLYEKADVKNVPKNGVRKITFITGCALLTRSSVYRKYGLLSERIFMAEDDYELSLRLKRNKLIIVCRFDSIIFHKVNLSSQGSNIKGKIYSDYLTKFVQMKAYMPRYVWKIWRLLYSLCIIGVLINKYKLPFVEISEIIKELRINSENLNSVDRETFFYALRRFNS